MLLFLFPLRKDANQLFYGITLIKYAKQHHVSRLPGMKQLAIKIIFFYIF